jgi:photolyase PhrII
MRVAMRAHENPALDVAAHIANTLGIPLLVLQTLEDDDAYASDRLHTFALESLRDAQLELAERGIHYALELRERRGDLSKWPVFCRAAAVVTEEMPVETPRAAAAELVTYHPACTVDASCVVPMPLSDRAPERAFTFRKETKTQRAERLGREWLDVTPERSARFEDLGFEPIELRSADSSRIAELVGQRTIDHLVGPVRDTPGGSSAGYARWQSFVESGLASYSQRRNDPVEADGVSRMSAYLHLGCVSPFRLARESMVAGADKYLDELLLWREVAWHFCYHTEGVDEFDALPEWARDTLETHAGDQRSKRLSWESLARAQSGEPLWDTAQRSLLAHGELHNNVRMTWGKAFLDWTASPQEALRLALDLNHRYALDGRDPASYGGILWCFGLFDRPFTPELPVRGTLRPRPIGRHAERLDVSAWAAHVDRPTFSMGRVAVIGAGIAGLTCARGLQDHGVDVTVFEKARGPGGRLSSRRSDVGVFDHGAQYFTAFDERFARYVDSWEGDEVVAQWKGRFATLAPGRAPLMDETKRLRFAGAPRMSALTRHLASNLTDPRYQTRVIRAERADGAWHLFGDGSQELGVYSHMVVALKAPQAAELLCSADSATDAVDSFLIETVGGAQLDPCWAVMVEFAAPIAAPFDAARLERSPLAWVAREASKPGRECGERWILQASPAWSFEHLEDEHDSVAATLAAEFARLVPTPEVTFLAAHRWRFARVIESAGQPCLSDPSAGLVVCGDWCLGPRVGAAWLSGAAAAGRLMGQLS